MAKRIRSEAVPEIKETKALVLASAAASDSVSGEEERKRETKTILTVLEAATPSSYHALLRKMPIQLIGSMFEFLNLYETARFLYATGRLGRDTLKNVYQSMLQINLFTSHGAGQKSTVERKFRGRDWQLVSNWPVGQPVFARLSNQVRIVRVHLLESIALDWVSPSSTDTLSILQSPRLEIIDFQMRVNHHEFNDAVFEKASGKKNLREFRWINPNASIHDEAIKPFLASVPALEILEIRFQAHDYLDDNTLTKSFRLLPRLRAVQIPVFDMDRNWISVLAQSCPLLELVDVTTRLGLAGWFAVRRAGLDDDHVVGNMAALGSLFASCAHLLCLTSTCISDASMVHWKRSSETDEWQLHVMGYDFRRRNFWTVGQLILASPMPLIHLDVTNVVVVRKLQQELTRVLRDNSQVRIRSLHISSGKGGHAADWPDAKRPWVDEKQMMNYRELWVPRGLIRVHLEPASWPGSRRKMILEVDTLPARPTGREITAQLPPPPRPYWRLTAIDVNYKSFMPFLISEKWMPVTELVYEAGRADAQELGGGEEAIWTPKDMFRFLLENSEKEMLRKVLLDGGRVGQLSSPPPVYDSKTSRVLKRDPGWKAIRNRIISAKSRVQLDPSIFLFHNLEELDLGGEPVVYNVDPDEYGQSQMLLTRAQMPHLTMFGATFPKRLIPSAHWLVWRGMIRLSFRDDLQMCDLNSSHNVARTKQILPPQEEMKAGFNDQSLVQLLEQNPRLESLWIDLVYSHLTTLEHIRSDTLVELALRLNREDIHTDELVALQKRCPRLTRLQIQLLDTTETKTETKAETKEKDDAPFLLINNNTDKTRALEFVIIAPQSGFRRDDTNIDFFTTPLLERKQTAHPPPSSSGKISFRDQEALIQTLKKVQKMAHDWTSQSPSRRTKDRWANELVQAQIDRDVQSIHRDMDRRLLVRQWQQQNIFIVPSSVSDVLAHPLLWQQQVDFIHRARRHHQPFVLRHVDSRGRVSEASVSSRGHVTVTGQADGSRLERRIDQWVQSQ